VLLGGEKPTQRKEDSTKHHQALKCLLETKPKPLFFQKKKKVNETKHKKGRLRDYDDSTDLYSTVTVKSENGKKKKKKKKKKKNENQNKDEKK